MAKRVNKPFVIILASTVGALLLALGGAYYYMSHRHPASYWVQKGDAARDAGKLLEARDLYGAAVSKQPSNPDLYMKVADMDERLVLQDRSFLDHARMVWSQAVQVDPTYKPAMDKLMDLYLEDVRGGATRPELFTELRRNAEMMARVDPGDVRAQIWSHAGTIQQWLNGVAFTNKAIDDDMAALSQILQKHPQAADAAYYLSQAQLRRARSAVADGRPEKAQELYDQVAARHEGLIKSQADNGAVQVRAYQVFVGLLDQDRRPEKADRYRADLAAAIQAAEANLKPDAPLFDEARHYYVMWLRSQNRDRKEIEKSYRDWVAARPSDAEARIELADYLSTDPRTRAEAQQILSTPLPTDPNAKGLAALRGRVYERAALLALNNLRAEDVRNMTAPGDRAHRDELLKQLDADLQKIVGFGFSEDYPYLRLRGKVEMLHNRVLDAMKTFERARTMSGGRFDPDLWIRLADAYLRTGQTGSAQRLLDEVAARIPGYAPARIMLAELYLNQHDSDRASQQIQKLDELAAGNAALGAEAARLRAVLLANQKQGTQARQEVSKLPEGTKSERLVKGELAAEAGDNAEALRLFNLILKDSPADLEAVGELVNLHMRDNHRDLARQVVAEALKAKPNDTLLITLQQGLDATTPEAIRKYQDQVADQIVDPLTKAIRKAGLALNRGEYAIAAQQLDAADKVHPDDPRTVELRYEWYQRQNRLADAAPLVDRVAKAGLDAQSGYAWRTRYALDRKDTEAALTNARALVGGYGELASAHLLLGRAEQAAGQLNDAIRSYNAALDRQPGNIEAMRSKAECLDLMGRYDEEKMVVGAALQAAPENPVVRDLSLNFELNHGDPLKVVDTCESLVQKEPENPAYTLALGQACTMLAQQKARIDKPMADKYLARANQVLSDGMTRFAALPQVQQYYGPRAQAMLLAGDARGAEQLLVQFVSLPDQKDKPDGYRQLASLYEQANRPDLAEKAWRTAYDKSGRTLDSELDLARFYNRFNRPDDALKVLEDNAGNPRVMTQRMDVLLTAGRIDQAQSLVDEALAKNSTDMTARFYRGVVELRKGDAVSAERDFSLFRDKDPQNVNGRLWLSRAMRARNNVSGAITELEAALKIAPTRKDVRMALLDAYSYGNSPMWEAFDRTIADAKADPQLNADPVWTQINARGLAKRGDFDRALAEIADARKAEPNSYSLRQDHINILLEAKKYKEVLDETDKSLAEGHKEGLIFEQRAVAKSSLGDKAGALQEFDAALIIASAQHDAEGASNLLKTLKQFIGVDQALARLDRCPPGTARDLLAIQFHLDKQDYAAAVNDADSLLSEPNLSLQNRQIGIRTKAESYYMLKQYDNSRKAFDDLLALKPDDWLVLNNVAYLVAEQLKQPQEARKYSGRAYDLVQRTGGNPTVADTHGWVLTLCQGRDAMEGLSILQKLAASPEAFPKARYHLAEAYLRQHRTDNAINELTLAKAQIEEMEKNHQPVENEVKQTIQQALDALEKGKSQTSSR